MYEYKVIMVSFKDADAELNKMAKEGWRVVNSQPNIAQGHGMIIILERQK